MNVILIALGIFVTLSFICSVLVIAVSARSSQISRELESPERRARHTVRRQVEKDGDFLKESAPA